MLPETVYTEALLSPAFAITRSEPSGETAAPRGNTPVTNVVAGVIVLPETVYVDALLLPVSVITRSEPSGEKATPKGPLPVVKKDGVGLMTTVLCAGLQRNKHKNRGGGG